MVEIAKQHIPFNVGALSAWQEIARAILAWADGLRLATRDLTVLVPLAQHVPLARRAFSREGRWMPRVESTRTLLGALPPVSAPAEGVSGLAAQDRLRALQWLGAQGWARNWRRQDPRGFEQMVVRFVDCAQLLARRAAAAGPVDREAWLDAARRLLSSEDGPGSTERMLARMALEWVAASTPWPTDALFTWQPAGWVLVQGGGQDLLGQALLQASAAPALIVDTDPLGDPLSAIAANAREARPVARTTLTRCESFEDEAQQAAARVLSMLREGRSPVVLVAQDRLLVRRAAALLQRQQVPVLDETGWKLSTSRAASSVMALLKASEPTATTDDLLDWLKALPPSSPVGGTGLVALLEQTVRRHGWTQAQGLAERSAMPPPARDLVLRAQELAEPLAAATRAAPSEWATRLQRVMRATGQEETLLADPAGQQVLRALRLQAAAEDGWSTLGAGTPTMGRDDFRRLVDDLLENAVYEPPPPEGEVAVVITPLRRAVLRPFAAAVMPGADERRLGAIQPADPLLGESVSVALGLPSAEQRQRDEQLAFAGLLTLPEVHLSYRHQDGDDVLGPSPLAERWALCAADAGCPMASAEESRDTRVVVPAPVPRPAPVAADRLPDRLSASTVEALRDCPYRFYARAVLGLAEADELDDEAQKRDYGTWLHAVLWRFHQQRPQPRGVDEDLAQLRHLARQEQEASGLDEASFLPFEASFERFVGHYAQWVQERDALGARWQAGEVERTVLPPELEGIALHGRIDRIDHLPGGARQLLDYKTKSSTALKAMVRDRLEDTQLAFYAALEMLNDDAPAEPIQAVYLALDESRKVEEIDHPEVEASARALLDGLSDELRRMKAGASLPALGDGRVCEFCEARGLCRRDHWGPPTSTEPGVTK